MPGNSYSGARWVDAAENVKLLNMWIGKNEIMKMDCNISCKCTKKDMYNVKI